MPLPLINFCKFITDDEKSILKEENRVDSGQTIDNDRKTRYSRKKVLVCKGIELICTLNILVFN